MSYNLQFQAENIAGNVPFIDSGHMRVNRGGLTIDAAQVGGNRVESAGQAILRNNRLILLAGSVVGLNAGSGRWEVYTPASAALAALLATGVVGDNNAITWEAVNAGAAGNNITLEYVDTRAVGQALDVAVAGTDITVTLAGVGGTAASAATGAADSEILWTAEQEAFPGADGNALSVHIVNDGEISRPAIVIEVSGAAIFVYPVTDGGGVITSSANDILGAVNAHATAGDMVQGAAVGAGTDPVLDAPLVADLSGGVDSVGTNTAAEVYAAVNADGVAGLLVQGADTGASTGAGDVVVMGPTNLDGGMAAAAENISTRRCMLTLTEADLQDGNAVINGMEHGRVISARLPLGASDATIRAALPQISFV